MKITIAASPVVEDFLVEGFKTFLHLLKQENVSVSAFVRNLKYKHYRSALPPQVKNAHARKKTGPGIVGIQGTRGNLVFNQNGQNWQVSYQPAEGPSTLTLCESNSIAGLAGMFAKAVSAKYVSKVDTKTLVRELSKVVSVVRNEGDEKEKRLYIKNVASKVQSAVEKIVKVPSFSVNYGSSEVRAFQLKDGKVIVMNYVGKGYQSMAILHPGR